jgi:hypothetical protein
MSIPFVNHDPTKIEFERFRLILSTYQDGSGQQALKNDGTLPGWRDFERSVAVAFSGVAQENKFIFDVLIPDLKREGVFFGISCKMRRTLDDTIRTGRVTLELSNSSGKFWERLRKNGINQQNYKQNPLNVADELIAQENEWHAEVGLDQGGRVDVSESFYLALSWNMHGEYQLFKFSLLLPAPKSLEWDFPSVRNNGEEKAGRRLRGQDVSGTLFEWYGESGGQLKYYPLAKNALWKSPIFKLEALPPGWESKHGIIAKARDYFPRAWAHVRE